MKKILPLFFTLLFLSCAEEEVDTLRLQSVYTEIEITNCQNTTFTVSGSGGTESFACSNNNYTHTTNTYQVSVIENTSFYYSLALITSTFNNTSCIDIITRVYHNNNLYETRSYSLGSPNITSLPCSNITVGEMYSIIAN